MASTIGSLRNRPRQDAGSCHRRVHTTPLARGHKSRIAKPRIALSIAPGRARPTHPQLHQRQTQPRAHHRYHRPATLKQSLPCHHYPATLVPHSHRLKSRPRRRQTLPAVKKSTSSHSSPQRSRALGKKGCRKQVPICVGQSAWRVQATGQKAAAGAARLGSR